MDNMTWHYWYSPTQFEMDETMPDFEENLNPRNFALIDGKIVEYTYVTKTLHHRCLLDDLRYLGEGTFHHREQRTLV